MVGWKAATAAVVVLAHSAGAAWQGDNGRRAPSPRTQELRGAVVVAGPALDSRANMTATVKARFGRPQPREICAPEVTTLDTRLCIDGREVEAKVRLWTERGEVLASVELFPDHCSLPDIDRVRVKLYGGRRSAELDLCRTDRDCDKGSAKFTAHDGVRIGGLSCLRVALTVLSDHRTARAQWLNVWVAS